MSRETAVLVALVALALASALASVGAWVRLWRDLKTRRAGPSAPD